MAQMDMEVRGKWRGELERRRRPFTTDYFTTSKILSEQEVCLQSQLLKWVVARLSIAYVLGVVIQTACCCCIRHNNL